MMTATRKKPEPVDRQVGMKVRTRRLELELSQTALGQQLGVTFQQVQKYEKGTNRIGASRLQQIALILKVPVSFFFEGLETKNRTPADDGQSEISEFIASPVGLSLVRAFCRIEDAKLRRRVVELVAQLAENNPR
jgi:transcriptional regulator with XRE-family HTH domain